MTKPEQLPKKSGSILIVDDEPAIRRMAATLLETEGFRVDCCSSGEAALAEISSRPGFDTVILDLEMPGMGGISCLENLRHLQPDLRVIVSSGFINSDNHRQLIELGAAGVLLKPYRKAELLSQVRTGESDR